MSGQDKILAELIRGLKHERDELKLQMHLAGKELQDEWQKLDDQLNELNHCYEPLRQAVAESAEGVWASMQALVARVEPAIAAVQRQLPAGFPERTAQTIFDGLRRQSRAWEAGLTGLS